MSEMLVMPTLFESVSIPIYEAFALQTCVCSSNVVALPEQVGDAGIIFNPNDISDISKNIMKILDNKDLKSKITLLGYTRVKNFNHQNYKNKLLKVLNA